MVKKNPNSEPLHIGGIGLPMIDFITKATGEKNSTRDELTAGLAIIREAKAKDLDDSNSLSNDSKVALFETREEGEQHIHEALAAFDQFEAFIAARGYKSKEKRPLSKEDDKQVAEWFGAIIRAAIDINRAAEFVGKPDQTLFIRHMGGTTYNKLHGVQMGLGDRVQTHLLGALGDKDEGIKNHGLVTMNLKAISKIDFHHLDNLSLGNMAIGYIWQKDGDRLAMSSCTPELLPLLQDSHLEQIRTFADQPPLDMYLVEGGDFGKNKFGDKAFAVFEERALTSGKPIMLGLPTNLKLIQSDTPDEVVEKNRERMFRLIDAPNTPFIGSNEEEAVAMFCNEKLCKKDTPETAGWTKAQIEEKAGKQIRHACELLQERLKKKAEHLGPDEVEPLAFVSNGVKGVYAITQNKIVLVPGNKHPELVNNIGAGDGLFAGSLIYYINHVTRPLNGATPIIRFSEDDLKEMFTMGQNVSYHIVGQKGAQLNLNDMMKAIHGHDHAVATKGTFSGATQHDNHEIYRSMA